jgi:restriction endonuclease S subunit
MNAIVRLSPRAFAVRWKDVDRWSVGSFVETEWHWPTSVVRPLSAALSRKLVDVERNGEEGVALRLVTLHFDGEMEPRGKNAGENFKGQLFYADPGDVIYSKIDVRNGAIGVVPEGMGRICVSSEYPVYSVDPAVADARYIKLLFRTSAFRRKINSMISGASGRKRVQPSDLEAIAVPLPPLPVQRKIVAAHEAALQKVDEARKGLARLVSDLDTDLRRLARLNVLKQSWLVARWKDLSALDMKSARAAVFKLDNPTFRPLGEFAEEATDLVKPWQEPEKDWPVYGVNNKEGVFFSHFQKGKAFNAPYKRIRKDWFFHNPTRSNVGSLGIVPDVPDDAITSPEYQVWRIKSGLLPGFVATLIATQFFLDLIQIHRVGAVKQRLYVDNLLQIPIPVVPDAIQRKIADCRESTMQEIADAKASAESARADVEAMILGTKPV